MYTFPRKKCRSLYDKVELMNECLVDLAHMQYSVIPYPNSLKVSHNKCSHCQLDFIEKVHLHNIYTKQFCDLCTTNAFKAISLLQNNIHTKL